MKMKNLNIFHHTDNTPNSQLTSKYIWKYALLMSLLLFTLMLSSTYSQDTKGESNIPPCFCCTDIAYQLPVPTITGPDPVCACPPVTYTTIKCPGATITWTVVDNLGNTVTFTGQSTSTITLNFPLAATATSLKITVRINCGRNNVQNIKTVQIKPTPSANFPYSITADGNGGYIINATGTSGAANAWRITEIVPASLPCTSWGYGPMLFPDQAIQNATYSGPLLPGHQYRIIHWVEKCSPTYVASDCRVLKWVCFNITPSANMAPNNGDGKSRSAFPAKGTKVQVNVSESMEYKELTPEMKESKK